MHHSAAALLVQQVVIGLGAQLGRRAQARHHKHLLQLQAGQGRRVLSAAKQRVEGPAPALVGKAC